MTLNTVVMVHDSIDVPVLFRKCQAIVGSNEGTRWYDRERSWGRQPGVREIGNEMDQGLCALLDVSYRRGRPLVEQPAHDEDCERDCSDWRHTMPHFAEVSFDTAYSYCGDDGENCSQLHQRLVAELGAYLDQQGIDWSWVNEYTGAAFHRFDGLRELASDGAQATAWFEAFVQPLIKGDHE